MNTDQKWFNASKNQSPFFLSCVQFYPDMKGYQNIKNETLWFYYQTPECF